MVDKADWTGIATTVTTDAVAAIPTVTDVAGQVEVLTDAHNDTATRVSALEHAVTDLLDFVTKVVLPSINTEHKGASQAPSVPVPSSPSTVSKGS